jgi:hypothetical protein
VQVLHRGLVADVRVRPRTTAWLWMRVWLRRVELDRRLAEGANPTTDPLRALRACQLTSRRYRRALARGLRSLVADACDPAPLRAAPGPRVNRYAVLDARDPLLSLSRRLVECENPCPRAVALASYIVCDPDSPTYWSATGATVADLAHAALAAIDHEPLR